MCEREPPPLPSPLGRWPVATLLGSLPPLLFAATPEASEALAFDRDAILRGELWRLVTSAFVHWSGEQLFWNLLVFVTVGTVIERRCRPLLVATLAAAALLGSVGFLLLAPDLRFYRGLSGIDSALVVLLAVSILREERERLPRILASAVLVSFGAKVLLESLLGSPLFASPEGFEVLPLSHLLGAAVGGAAAVLGGTAPPRETLRIAHPLP
jgi:rhomboid family GlyGly-CTERM serine protease